MHHIRRHTFGLIEAYEVGLAPFGKPIKTVYFYIIGNVIVDTGPFHLRRHVKAITEEKDISLICLTHHHEDHSGNAALLGKMLGASVYIHEYGAKKLKNGFNILPYQRLLFGHAPPTETLSSNKTLEAATIRLIPYHTPGHSKDHTVYLEPNNGLLFSGDLYLGEKIQFFRVDEHIHDQICSLEKILRLDFDALFCGHRPSPKGGKKKLAAKLSFLQSFHGEVGRLLGKGYGQKAIIQTLQIKSDLGIRLFTMGNASFANMVRSSIQDNLSQGL